MWIILTLYHLFLLSTSRYTHISEIANKWAFYIGHLNSIRLNTSDVFILKPVLINFDNLLKIILTCTQITIVYYSRSEKLIALSISDTVLVTSWIPFLRSSFLWWKLLLISYESTLSALYLLAIRVFEIFHLQLCLRIHECTWWVLMTLALHRKIILTSNLLI